MLQINDFKCNFRFYCYRVFSSSMFWTTTRHDQKVNTNSNPFHEISLSNVTFAPFSCRVYVKTFQYLIRYNSILVLVFQCERTAVHFQATSVDKSILRDIINCWVWKMKATYHMNRQIKNGLIFVDNSIQVKFKGTFSGNRKCPSKRSVKGKQIPRLQEHFFQSGPKLSSLSLNKGGRGKSNTCIPFRVFISACPMTSLTASLMKTNVFRVRRKSAID